MRQFPRYWGNELMGRLGNGHLLWLARPQLVAFAFLQAYDLRGYCEVAVKVHTLAPSWSRAQKASYVMRAKREYEIHRTLTHPNIVPLLDVFEISDSQFATVLELCEGGDLESHIRAR